MPVNRSQRSSVKPTKHKTVGNTVKKQTRHTVKKSTNVVSTDAETSEISPAKITASWIRATSEAIASFDFERAAEYYEKLEWSWITGKLTDDNTERKIPAESDIREEVTRMINACVEGVMAENDAQTSYHCSTGGLYVVAYKYPNPDDNWIWIGMTVVETMY